ncbi:MAG: hypothetical protein CMH59_18565, partial [Myxococcales bacterium]|nr:hypothetical protein [Myxococcales bacterium]
PKPPASTWAVHVSPDAPEAVVWAAEDVVEALGGMGLEARLERSTGALGCASGEGRVLLAGDGLEELALAEATDQTWRIATEACGDGRRVHLAGGGLLGRQYAAYEWLHGLGVRFFHPEEEIVPAAPRWPAPFLRGEPTERQHTPAFRWRSASLHLTHPLELGDAFRTGEHEEDGRRYIDWLVKNLASFGHPGVGSGELADYGLRRGFPPQAGMRLYGAQQGSTAILDPDDPRPAEEQIAEAIDERMSATPRPAYFSFGFDPSEFTEVEDTVVVEQLGFVADHFAEHYPDVILQTTNHGTAGEPTETYGIRYYDLPKLAPENLGVKVHTLMFYDLFRPAPVYGNEDFSNLYDFMEEEYLDRNLWYFPESAWWLTFDNAIPLYLPITIEARDRDIQGIAHMLEGGLDGHRVFGTGHEWGYWQNEYCSFRMAADLAYRWTDCLGDIASVMGGAEEEVAAVLQAAVERQEEFMFDAEAIRWLVGTDPETEIADSIGVVFHPLPPTPRAMLRWDADEVAAFEAETLPLLEGIERDFFLLASRLNAVEDAVPEGARNVFGEIRDGLEAFQLRARHQRQVYGAVALLRRSQLEGDASLRAMGEAELSAAGETTERVLEVIRRREAGYRYAPLERAIAGGPEGTDDENWTIYDYRYLNRTHHGYYFTRIDAMAQEAFEGAREAVIVEDAVLGPGEALSLRLDASLEDAEVDFGDGETATGPGPFTHEYAPGIYALRVRGTREGEAFERELPIAAVRAEAQTGFSGVVVEPEGASIIEGVLPALAFGAVDEAGEGARLALGFSADEESHAVAPAAWVELGAAGGGAGFANAPATMEVPVLNRATGQAITSITLNEAVLTREEGASEASVEGLLDTAGVVRAVVAVGGFDEQGARRILADTLGYTPETLPEELAFTLAFDVE